MPVRKLVHLQMLRAVAASLVVADHCIGLMVHHGMISSVYEQPGWLLGGLGVGTFFVISGLIMARTTDAQHGPAAAGAFAIRRIMRVAPMYWVVSLVAFPIAAVRHGAGAFDLLRSFLFIPYVRDGAFRPLVAQGWTLNYEMFFYALFAASLLLPKFRIAALASVLALLVFVSLLFHP